MTVLDAPPRPQPADPVDVPTVVLDAVVSAQEIESTLPQRAVWAPAVAAALACGVPAALVGGLFRGAGVTVVAVIAAACGALLAGGAARSARPAVWHLGLVPAVAVAAAASAVPGAPDALGRLGELVADAVNSGRAGPPPLAFDPGWRPILVAAFAALGFAAAWVGSGVGRPRLALAVPLPVGVLATLVLPPPAEARAAAIAGIFLFAALAVLHATQPARAAAGAVIGTVRAAVMVAVIAVAVAGLGRIDALFPEARVDTTPAPRRPEATPPPADDRVLFEIAGPLEGPWRLGTLDVYGDDGWLARPRDPDDLTAISAQVSDRNTPTVTITVGDLGDGRVLPAPPGLVAIDGIDAALDPRSGAVIARRPPAAGASYVAAATVPPSLAEISTASLDTSDAAALAGPTPPSHLDNLLAGLPADRWERFLALRARLADRFVAVGAGGPVPTTPERVVDLLDGVEGTPYERAAAEAVLARWSGVPARVGYGYAGGDAAGERRLIRTRHAAYWAEVHLAGRGWIPILLDAAQAAAAAGDADQLARAGVTPSDEVPVELVIPIRRTTTVLLYQRARGALLAILVPLAVAAAVWLAWPTAARWARRRRRIAWAATAGPRAQIAVAYAEWRDLAIDLGITGRGRTPLGFCTVVVTDAEHEQLAWLVTRTLYGDLADTADADDTRAADDLARSLRRRLLAAQPIERRLAARVSRTSLRTPYSTEVPGAPNIGRRPAPATRPSPHLTPTGATA